MVEWKLNVSTICHGVLKIAPQAFVRGFFRSLLGFPIKFDRVLQHLRQDMRDDWYFDCLHYEDFFQDADSTKRIIILLLQEWNGAYRGTRSVVRNIPKTGYGERYGLETDFFDRFIYQAICSFLIPYYDKLL